MIDWLTIKVQVEHVPIRAGMFMSVDANGAVEYQTPKASSVEGSYSSSMRFRSTGCMTLAKNQAGGPRFGLYVPELNQELSISGNPSKWLQGHNIFGCEDGVKMVTEVLKRLPKSMGLHSVSDFAIRSAIVSRIDFTKSLQFENLIQCQAFIREVGLRARTRNGRPVLQGSTVGFQKGSKRWNLVVYAKGDEVRAHELPEDLPKRKELIQEALRLVRVELRLRGNELYDLGLRSLGQLTSLRLSELYREYLEKVEMSTSTSIPDETFLTFSRAHRSTYLLWHSGLDVVPTMSIPTFYRHRAELKKYGVDISIPRNCEGPTVVPLHKVITGQPYVSPEWADGTLLKFGS